MDNCDKATYGDGYNGDVCVPDSFEYNGGYFLSSYDSNDSAFTDSFYFTNKDACTTVNKCSAPAPAEKTKDDIGATSLLVASSATVATAILTLV